MGDEPLRCPHHEVELKIAATTVREAGNKTTETTKYKCPVDRCGYTHTLSVTTED